MPTVWLPTTDLDERRLSGRGDHNNVNDDDGDDRVRAAAEQRCHAGGFSYTEILFRPSLLQELYGVEGERAGDRGYN